MCTCVFCSFFLFSIFFVLFDLYIHLFPFFFTFILKYFSFLWMYFSLTMYNLLIKVVFYKKIFRLKGSSSLYCFPSNRANTITCGVGGRDDWILVFILSAIV